MTDADAKRELIGPADARVSQTVYPPGSRRQASRHPHDRPRGGRSVELADIAEVQMGYTFRSGLEDEAQGAMRVIQTKDLGDDGIVAHDSLFRTTLSVPQAQRVRAGDIVVRSRGGKATSALVASDPGDTVVAAPLLRVRVTDPRVTPAYLNWYINQPPTQAYLAKRAEGTHMKMISKIMLEGLPVLVPSAARQERIIRLAGLSARERILSVELLALREKLRSAIMSEYAWGANGGAETERPRRGSR